MNITRGDRLSISGEPWVVCAVGARAGKRVYVHVKSETRGTHGKAGFIPAQECGWFDGEQLHASECLHDDTP